MPDEVTSKSLLKKVAHAKALILDEERSEAVAKRHDREMLTARERIDYLLDDGTFREIGGLVEPYRGNVMNRELKAPADGAITGTGVIEGREACLVAQDYTVLGGSIGTVADRKMWRVVDRAADRGIPLVLMLEGGGHRIQDGMNAAHFAGASPIFSKLARLSGWVPNIVAIMGQGFAGPTAYAALADFVVMIKGRSTMGIAGPALVKAGTGSDISKEELGGEKRQADQQGIADLAVNSEQECLDAIKRYLSYFPKNASEPLPIIASDDPVDRRDDKLLGLVTANSRKVYDMRKVIKIIADKGSVFEKKPTYAKNMLTCLARLGGRPVGFIANQPMHKGGILDAAACEKAAHFIAVCDAFGIPLVSLIDIPGFSIGEAAEDTGLGRRSGRLFYEMAMATVPLVSVVLRKGYGGGYYAMGGGRSFNAEASYAWPTAEICAMSIKGAVDVAYKKEYQAADDPDAARQAMIDDIESQTSAIHAAHDFGIDDVIDPRDTRRLLIETFNSCPPRRPDLSPPRLRSISPI
jgi:acetyl-CoA carboxylase carboxyltransferase component